MDSEATKIDFKWQILSQLFKINGPYESICLIKFGPESEIIHTLPVASTIKKHLTYSLIIQITDEAGIQLINGHVDIDSLKDKEV